MYRNRKNAAQRLVLYILLYICRNKRNLQKQTTALIPFLNKIPELTAVLTIGYRNQYTNQDKECILTLSPVT